MTSQRGRTRRPPLLIAIQTEATLLMSLAIGQAGLAAAFITGRDALKKVHEINAFVVGTLVVITLLTAIAYRRTGGPRWPVGVSALLVVLTAAQITLGLIEVAGAHIFVGVLYVVSVTLFTSYLFRPGFTPPTVQPSDVTPPTVTSGVQPTSSRR